MDWPTAKMWKKTGWWFSIKDGGKTSNILILKDKLKDAARDLKLQNNAYQITRIERHEGKIWLD
jgi:hypothetical protein